MASKQATSHRQTSRSATDTLGQYLSEISRHDLLTPPEEVELAKAVQAGVAASEELQSGDALTPRRTRELRQARADGEDARRRFVNANLRLVVSVARSARQGRSQNDLLEAIQEGNLGLMRAVEKFDWRKGYKFSTYAMWWIRQAISRTEAMDSPVSISAAARVEMRSVDRVKHDSLMAGREGKEMSDADAVDWVNGSMERVEKARAWKRTASLDATLSGDSQSTIGDTVADTDLDAVDDQIVEAEMLGRLAAAMGRLTEDERLAVSIAHDGLSERQSCQAIADRLGVSREKARLTERRGMAKLRHPTLGLTA